MTAGPGGSVIEGLRTLEVRWLLPGRLDAAVAGWFGRFPTEAESREDTYLVDRDLHGLSVKVRAGRALEVKMYHGIVGALDVPGRARGRIQAWQKWSFPVSPGRQEGDGPPGWTVIRKRRRISRFRLAAGGIAAGVPGWASEPGCTVELTEVEARDETWWSLGFEAAGPADLVRPDPVRPDPVRPDPVRPDPVRPDPVRPDLVRPDLVRPDAVRPDLVRRALEDTAALIFARALPGGAELGLGDCRSYAEWLSCTTCRSLSSAE